jgi:hypothetical protein
MESENVSPNQNGTRFIAGGAVSASHAAQRGTTRHKSLAGNGGAVATGCFVAASPARAGCAHTSFNRPVWSPSRMEMHAREHTARLSVQVPGSRILISRVHLSAGCLHVTIMGGSRTPHDPPTQSVQCHQPHRTYQILTARRTGAAQRRFVSGALAYGVRRRTVTFRVLDRVISASTAFDRIQCTP